MMHFAIGRGGGGAGKDLTFLYSFLSSKSVGVLINNVVILKRLSGNEQPSDMEMHSGKFVEVDSKDGNRMGKFLYIKVIVDLSKPRKRGIMVKYRHDNGAMWGWLLPSPSPSPTAIYLPVTLPIFNGDEKLNLIPIPNGFG
ncbi:hypothetical protein MTR_0008s0180 [Medicago truncatula]|uniref:Uncharacterized protein n=1 Tax=Medicago truncatula TaxID=3880 RepID=A0A072TVI8_MEDTR|nr:hypothetical protein MTR_0008s0180 [Medicago truncatula]